VWLLHSYRAPNKDKNLCSDVCAVTACERTGEVYKIIAVQHGDKYIGHSKVKEYVETFRGGWTWADLCTPADCKDTSTEEIASVMGVIHGRERLKTGLRPN